MFGNSPENQTKGSKNNISNIPQVQVIVSTDPQKTDVVSITTTSKPNRSSENTSNPTNIIEKNVTGNISSLIKDTTSESANLIVSQKPPTKKKLFIRYSSSSALVVSKNNPKTETTLTKSASTTPQVSKFNIDNNSIDDKDLLYNSEKSFEIYDEKNSIRRPSSLLNSGGIICRPMLREPSPSNNTLSQYNCGYSKSCRRKSMHTSAFNNTLGLRPIKTIDRRASQPLLKCSDTDNDKIIISDINSIGLQNITIKDKKKDKIDTTLKINGVDKVSGKGFLTKRVSWMSMKSLLEGNDTFTNFFAKSKNTDNSYCISNRSETHSNSQYESNVNLNEIFDLENDTPPLETMSWSNADEYENVTLMYAKHEKIPMKDFGSEIRATMDIDHLLNKSVLLLDLQETSLEEIFAKIIHEMDIQEPEFTSEQVRSVLFTQDAGNQFHILSRTVQSICTTGTVGGTFDYDQTWICALCMLNTVQHRHVAIARLSHPTNLGRTMQDLRFIIIVIAPSRAKGTKTALETTRTFATLFADMDIRQRLVMAQTVEQFRSTLLQAAKELAMEQNQWRERKTSIHLSQAKEQLVEIMFGPGRWYPFRGLIEDFKRRWKHYTSDYVDGFTGHRTMQKLISSVIFLYFACILPAIAFGVLNDDNTGGGINVRKVIFAQAIGGIFFAIFGGQPMIILLTTVPLAIYIKVIYRISQDLGYDFFAMYACVGLWCQIFLIIYASTELCSLMKLATRSAEEMFSLFIAIAFTVESVRAMHTSFTKYYQGCDQNFEIIREKTTLLERFANVTNMTFKDAVTNFTMANETLQTVGGACNRDTSILYMLLMFGTLWLGLFLYNFRKTPYLTRSRREWLADYALPASVLIMSFAGAYCFSEIHKDMFDLRNDVKLLEVADLFSLPWQAYLVSALLGFSLSFLFFMDQNITSAIVNNSQNKLKKGTALHLDLFVVAILNCFLSIFGLPWMHGALPHSPLHIRALADVEERVAQGHVHEVIMNVRETRISSLIAHILILISTFTLIPFPLQLIPTSVLHGLFLYMALTSLTGNEMFERLLLLITEQQAYPPTHYIRRVPQRKVHLFTACQLAQLVLLCAIGFSPYPFIEMVFPIVCFFFLPIRHTLIPRLIDYKYLDALDGRH
ncbi:Sodium bicarbonate transporter-like protein 11 [Strongyloides ratti]|uniref:Sodium bicarbonate transporter-like protein 11 n=1 Tax=Strongyloides ratti TaxID=34506 RepID=A0A090N0Q2_STRRB|nr:Sodium bicarbonate transporter-like protein 11 [Strongyloides ratti]CEF71083.1 Sodium bicarbonate transporter-like protein 11 [Strongyloides ratti]